MGVSSLFWGLLVGVVILSYGGCWEFVLDYRCWDSALILVMAVSRNDLFVCLDEVVAFGFGLVFSRVMRSVSLIPGLR